MLTGELKKVFRNVVDGDITALTLDGRNCKFLCGTHSGIVSEFTAVNGAYMKELGRGTIPAHTSEVSGLAYSTRHKCGRALPPPMAGGRRPHRVPPRAGALCRPRGTGA